MILKRVAGAAAVLAVAGCLAGCATTSTGNTSDGAPDGIVTDVPIVEAQLSTGWYLNCMQNETGLFWLDKSLDCDWNSAHQYPTSGLEFAGTYQVFQKRNDWNSVFDCISVDQFWGGRIDSCDYAHKRQINVTIS